MVLSSAYILQTRVSGLFCLAFRAILPPSSSFQISITELRYRYAALTLKSYEYRERFPLAYKQCSLKDFDNRENTQVKIMMEKCPNVLTTLNKKSEMP